MMKQKIFQNRMLVSCAVGAAISFVLMLLDFSLPIAPAFIKLDLSDLPALVLAFHSQGKEIYWKFKDIIIPGARELGERLAEVSGYTLADPAFNSGFAGRTYPNIRLD